MPDMQLPPPLSAPPTTPLADLTGPIAGGHGAPAGPAPVGHKVAGGFAWMTGQAVVTKVISLAGQIVLARLLDQADFGLVGLALTVWSLASSLQSAGINEVLIQRFGHFRRWATPAFWISATSGLLAVGLMCTAAPLVARACHDGRLMGLIFLLALCAPFDALSMLPAIWLQGHMRFTFLAKLEIARVAAVTALSIVFASLGLGAASFILPMPIVAAARTAVLWNSARVKVRWNPQLGRWRYLLKDSGLVTGIGFISTVVSQGDYMMLGILHSKAVVGVYFFSFGLSAQAITIVVARLSDVLFPALSHLQLDSERQSHAFTQASRLLALIAFPGCLLQAALAGPIMRVAFGAKWTAAIPVFAVLSVGLMSEVIAGPAWSLLRAQGRFAAAFGFSLARAIVFLAVVFIAARIGAALSVAIAVAAFLWVSGPSLLWLSLRGRHVSAAAMLKLHGFPLVLTLAALAPALGLGWLVRLAGGNDVAFAAVVASCDLALYAVLFRLAAPEEFAALWQKIMLLRSSKTTK